MGPADLDDAEFAAVDWETVSSRRPRPALRTVGFLVPLLTLAGAYAYDYVVGPDELVWFLHWDVTRLDWLALLSAVVFVRYAVVPPLADRERSGRYVRAFLRRPSGVLALAYLVGFFLVGLFGLEFIDSGTSYARLNHKLQPPVYTSVNTSGTSIYNCVGSTAGEKCYGTWRYPLGTTYLGEDIVELLIRGIRAALKIAAAAGLLMAVAGTAVGVAAGYYGGLVDDLLMRYVDVQQTVPAIVVYLVLATMYFGNFQGVSDGGLFAFVLVFGLLDWGGIARVVRGETLRRRSAGYVRAARAAGASDLHVLRRHVLPNSTATLVTALTRRIPLLILAQVALAYIELNRSRPLSLGRLLRFGMNGKYVPSWTRQWWITTIPVVVLVLLVVSFNVFGDTLRDVLDPEEGVE